jgi:hypothetical protein
MPSFDNGTPSSPLPWEESASFRETMLVYIDEAQARGAVREAGRVLYDLTIEASHGIEERGSATRAELRAGQADLHYLGGWFEAIRQQEQQSSLTEDDMALTRFAGQVAAQLANLEAEIERRLA